MSSLIRHFAGWCLRALGLVLVVRGIGLLEHSAPAMAHLPRAGSIVTGMIVLLLASWTLVFWKRGGDLMHSPIPLPIAAVWVPLRTLLDTLAVTWLLLGLCACLLLLSGGTVVQESLLNVSFAKHVTTEHIGLSVVCNWLIHSTTAALVYSAGLRFTDALEQFTQVQDRS